jgi:hypothetical protein
MFKHFGVHAEQLNKFYTQFIKAECLLTLNKTHVEYRRFEDMFKATFGISTNNTK